MQRGKSVDAAALASGPVAPAEVMEALNYVDDFIARCNGNDGGSCESVNVLRRALSAPVAGEAQPVAWAAVHSGGKRDGCIYSTCDTREEIEAYI